MQPLPTPPAVLLAVPDWPAPVLDCYGPFAGPRAAIGPRAEDLAVVTNFRSRSERASENNGRSFGFEISRPHRGACAQLRSVH